MKPCAILLLAVILVPLSAPAKSGDTNQVARVLDDFHAAAAAADFDRYFSHFAAQAVYLGTDAGERWDLNAFRSFVKPYFDQGHGWTYVPRGRHISIGANERTAWFDEILENASYGQCRSSGVLIRTPKGWQITQYHLTIPIPNALAKTVVEQIRNYQVGANKPGSH